MVDKKLVATTVSSREIGMQRRINPVTTSSHDEKTNRNQEVKEDTTKIHISFKRKDSKKLFFTRVKKENTKKRKEVQQQALETQCHRMMEKRKQQRAKASTPGQLAEKAKTAAAKPRL